ncbi:MAG: hypothetical protein M8350_08990 [Methanosarcinaceae archaeon]|nr:hypothetical protein [Methanosarcinaceae archaeon]
MGNDKIDHDPHDENDDDLDELMMGQLQKQRRPVHRRSDGYERKHIYRGAVVKQDENSDADTDPDNNE